MFIELHRDVGHMQHEHLIAQLSVPQYDIQALLIGFDLALRLCSWPPLLYSMYGLGCAVGVLCRTGATVSTMPSHVEHG